LSFMEELLLSCVRESARVKKIREGNEQVLRRKYYRGSYSVHRTYFNRFY